MTHRIFVKVTGFTDVERHALNTVFRLSEHGGVTYSLWVPDAPGGPRLAIVDGGHADAQWAANEAKGIDLQLVWIGDAAPDHAVRVFQRPIAWTDVVIAMDEMFLPEAPVDFDLGIGEDDTGAEDTRPPELADGPPPRKALVVSRSGDERMYLRAKLVLSGWAQADEAKTGAQALELGRKLAYEIAVVEDLPDYVEPWEFLRDLRETLPSVRGVVLIQPHPTLWERFRAWRLGARLIAKPPHPGRLHHLLSSFRG